VESRRSKERAATMKNDEQHQHDVDERRNIDLAGFGEIVVEPPSTNEATMMRSRLLRRRTCAPAMAAMRSRETGAPRQRGALTHVQDRFLVTRARIVDDDQTGLQRRGAGVEVRARRCGRPHRERWWSGAFEMPMKKCSDAPDRAAKAEKGDVAPMSQAGP